MIINAHFVVQRVHSDTGLSRQSWEKGVVGVLGTVATLDGPGSTEELGRTKSENHMNENSKQKQLTAGCRPRGTHRCRGHIVHLWKLQLEKG